MQRLHYGRHVFAGNIGKCPVEAIRFAESVARRIMMMFIQNIQNVDIEIFKLHVKIPLFHQHVFFMQELNSADFDNYPSGLKGEGPRLPRIGDNQHPSVLHAIFGMFDRIINPPMGARGGHGFERLNRSGPGPFRVLGSSEHHSRAHRLAVYGY